MEMFKHTQSEEGEMMTLNIPVTNLVTSTSHPTRDYFRTNPRHYVLSSENTSVCI